MATRTKKNDEVAFGKVTLPRFEDKQHEDFTPEPEVFKDPYGYVEKLAYAWEMGWDVLLLGKTGVGKTALVRHLCGETNSAYRRFPCQEATDTAALIGKPWLVNEEITDSKGAGTGEFRQEMLFQRGIVYDALLQDHKLVLDEWNLAHPDVQMALNPLFRVDEGQLIVTENEGEVVQRGEHFRLIATGNPSSYAGVKAWNAAQKSRFDMVLQMKYLTPEIEYELLMEQVTVEERVGWAMCQAALAVRDAEDDMAMRFAFSYRELHNWAEASSTFGVAEAAEIAVVSKADDEDERASVRDVIAKPFDAADWSA